MEASEVTDPKFFEDSHFDCVRLLNGEDPDLASISLTDEHSPL